jgi:hypothetical protein
MKPARPTLRPLVALAVAGLVAGAAVSTSAQPASLSDPIQLPGDAAMGPAAGRQQQPEIARGGDQHLAVWVDGRSDLAGVFNFGSGPYRGLDLGTMWDIYAARLDAAGNVVDTTPIVVNQDPFNQTFPSVAWNGSHWLVVWSGQAVGDAFGNLVVNVYGARVAPDGSVLDPDPIVIDTTTPMDDLYWPAVASDGQNWLVVWRDLDEQAGIWVLDGARIAADGSVLDPGGVPIRHPSSNAYPTDPDVVYLDDRYFVVWFEGAGHTRGRFFDTDAQPLGADFRINPTHPGGAPDVTHDGTQFFVVWADGSVPGYDVVRAARVSLSGTLLQTGLAVTPLSGFGCYAPAAAWNGSEFVVTYERGLLDPVTLRAARVSSAGQVLANEILLAGAGDHADYSELVTLAGGGVLSVWEDDRHDVGDVFTTVIPAGGAPAPAEPLALGTPRQSRPDAAATDLGHLVSYHSELGGEVRVLVHRLDTGGWPLPGEPIVVASGGQEIRRPTIASTGSHTLVVWEDAELNRIFGVRLLADGTVLDAAPLDLLPGNTPDVAAVGDRFLVISSHEPFNHVRYPTVARVDALTGALLDAPFTIGSSYAVEPHVVGLADRWLAVWERNPTHDNPTPFGEAAFVREDGVALNDFSISSGAQPLPTAAATPDTAAFVFPEGSESQALDVYARRILAGGGFLDAGDVLLAGEAGFQRAPAAAWSGDVFLATWVDNRADTAPGAQTVGDLYAARLGSDGQVFDLGGFPVFASPLPEAQPFAGGADGLGLLGGAVMKTEPFAAYRISYRILNQPLTGSPEREAPRVSSLLGARPNPFNPRTTVAFELARSAHVTLRVYDARGRLLRSLHDGTLPAGRHALAWDGRDDAGRGLGSGVYLLRLEGDGVLETRRCTLVR